MIGKYYYTEARGGGWGITNVVDSTTRNEHRLGGSVHCWANLEQKSRATDCLDVEAWRINWE